MNNKQHKMNGMYIKIPFVLKGQWGRGRGREKKRK
jgi:hypothetical protein